MGDYADGVPTFQQQLDRVTPVIPVAPVTKVLARLIFSLLFRRTPSRSASESTGTRSWQSYSRSKGSAVLVNEFLQCRRRAAADFLNQIIRPGEDTVLMIDGDFTQMLDGEGISLTFGFWFELAIESPRVMPRRWFLTARGHHCQHRLNAHLLILHLPPQDAAEDLGDLGISELNRSVKRINLAAMRVRVFQNPHDHTGLVLRRNRSVSTGAEWDVQHSGANHRCKIEQPFGKVRGAKMGRGNSRPVEDLLREPMILRRVAQRVLASRFLRHVHDAFEAGLFSGLSEVGCRLQNAGADRITEVCAANSSHRRAHVVELQKIADNHLCAHLFQPF